MLNSLYDPQLVQNYHSEYLKLIKYYSNIKRPSSFIRYYNIDIDNSTYDEKLEATYDMYHISNIRFNLYDFTPSFYLAPVLNASGNVSDLRGQMLDATTSIVTYSIEKPRIHDLVMFYSPVKSDEIFRVTNFRTPVNAIHSDPSLTWFEIDLEYAPLADVIQLKLLNHYVYDLSEEVYITYADYIKFMELLKNLEILLKQITAFYDNYNDLYQYEQLVPVEVNELLIFFKRTYAVKFKRILEQFLLPYGYLDNMNFQMVYSNVNELLYIPGNYTYHVYNLVTKQVEDYTWSISHTEDQVGLDELFLLSFRLLQLAYDWKI